MFLTGEPEVVLDDDGNPIEMAKCPICERNFQAARLDKHKVICAKRKEKDKKIKPKTGADSRKAEGMDEVRMGGG